MSDIYFYIHIPFCYKKCPYCAFVSFEKSFRYLRDYIEAVKQEIKTFDTKSRVKSIYFGGGTPSTLKIEQIDEILNLIYASFNTNIKEITFEIMPAVLKINYLKDLASLGINRLSLGVQSFSKWKLRKLGRIHSPEDNISCIQKSKDAGFENISIDLIYGVGETLKELEYDIKTALNLDIKHISTYMLMIEEDTEFSNLLKANQLCVSNEKDLSDFYIYLCSELPQYGFSHYEISNFAKRGFESLHNMAYWNGEEYKGFGLAASSFLDKKRIKNTLDLEEYIKDPVDSFHVEEVLSIDELIREMFVLGLRKKRGINIREFNKKFNIDIENFFKVELDKFYRQGLIKKENGRIFLSNCRAFVISNAIMSEFI